MKIIRDVSIMIIQSFVFVDNSILSISTIKKWAETRWDSRWTSINSIIENYKPLIQSLEELANEDTERSIDARGLLLAIQEPMFIVTIFILHRLFGKIKILSDQLKCKILFEACSNHYLLIFFSSFFHEYSAKSLDFGTAHILIESIIHQLRESRNEEEFRKLFEQIIKFANENGVDLHVTVRPRKKAIPSRFKDCIIDSTVGQREIIGSEYEYRNRIFYPIIDSILIELKDRFSKSNLEILQGISSLSPDSTKFLEMDNLKHLCNMIKCDVLTLNNEIQVLISMLKQSKSKDIVDLYFELLPFQQAFPVFISLLLLGMTIPVSSTTTERSFSKMKLIKNSARNSMTDMRLSDLTLLSIERDINIEYDKILESFAIQHRNSRILLI